MIKKFLIPVLLSLTSITALAEKKGSSLPVLAPEIVLDESVINFNGEVNAQSVSVLVTKILTAKSNDVTVFITSPGGSVIAGGEGIETIRSSGKTVTCIASFAASMAFAIFQEACNVRVVMATSVIMQHEATLGLEAQPLPNQKNVFELYIRLIKSHIDLQAARIGLSPEAFEKKISQDWWIYGAENISQKTADKLARVTCSQTVVEMTEVETVPTMFGVVQVTRSLCPLIVAPIKVESPVKNLHAEEAFWAQHFKMIELMRHNSLLGQ